VLNLSLGGSSACTAAYQAAIDAITAQGAVIVASAGNEGGPVDLPANCKGVIAVTGVRHAGTKVGYANVSGSFAGVAGTVTIAAPAGNCFYTAAGQPCVFSIDTLTNAGLTAPDTTPTGYIYTDKLNNINIGTSFSSPIVAGIAALMYSVNSRLTPAQIAARLKSSANPFPNIPKDNTGATIPQCHVATSATDLQNSECNCTTATCGAGLADAHQAVLEALRPAAQLTTTGTNAPGQTVNFDASTSFAADGHALTGYTWNVVAFTSPTMPTLGANSGVSSSLMIPACGTVTVALTVTDDAARTDTLNTTYGTACASVPNVVGQTQAAAASALTAASLALGTVATQSSSSVASGEVISESPAAGTNVVSGTAINVVVSSGPPPSGGGGALDAGTLALGALLALAASRRRSAAGTATP
jgi:serine protease